MAFDWPRFLDQHAIGWVGKGPSATKGNIAAQCPWCGQGDPSHHLAISTEGKGYRCFRVKSHSGKSVPRLIQAMTGCSWGEALRLAGVPSGGLRMGENALADSFKRLSTKAPSAARDGRKLSFPVGFRPLAYTGSGRQFVNHLIDRRGYAEGDIPLLAARYQLQTCVIDHFRYRLIFPIYMDGALVNWTGRSIAHDAWLRYRTLSADPERAAEEGLPAATMSIEQTLWNYDNLTGGRELYVCEGPFDAMKLDYYGHASDIHATATYTKSVSDAQIALLDRLSDRYDMITRVLDNDAKLDVLAEQSRLRHLGLRPKQLPEGFKDPDELRMDSALEFLGI